MKNLQNLSIDEMRSYQGGELVIGTVGAICLVGGFFVAGVVVGAAGAYVVYKATH